MIFVSSLFGGLTKQKSVSEETILKLNQALHLASEFNGGGMRLPIMLQSLVWNGEEIDLVRHQVLIDKKLEEKPEKCADMICCIAPKWIHYPGEKDDVKSLIKQLPIISN